MISYPTGQAANFCDPELGNDDYRFALGEIEGHAPGSPPVVVIGMNPSHARETESEKTVNHVIDVSARKHSGWLVLNLYPERSPKPKALKPYDAGLSAANCEAIEQVLSLEGATEVLGAWGNMGGSTTLKRALPDVLAVLDRLGVRIYTLDALLKTGNPRHPYPRRGPLPMLGPKKYLP